MNEEIQAAILLTLGALAVRLGLTDTHLAYVRPAMAPLLVLTGAVLMLLGGSVLLGPGRRFEPHHTGGSRVGWLLLAPVLTIALIVPRPLGSFAAYRAAASSVIPEGSTFGPLPAPSAPGAAVELPLNEFVGRASHPEGGSLQGANVRLTGFVVPDARGGGFLLTRFLLACCAADARPVRVAIRGVPGPWPQPDTWIDVIGRWRPERRSAEDDRPPILDAVAVRPVGSPTNPYLG